MKKQIIHISILTVLMILISSITHYLYLGQLQDEILEPFLYDNQIKVIETTVFLSTFMMILAFGVMLPVKQHQKYPDKHQLFSLMYAPISFSLWIVARIFSDYTYFWSYYFDDRLRITLYLMAGYFVGHLIMLLLFIKPFKSKKILSWMTVLNVVYTLIVIIFGFFMAFVVAFIPGPHG